MEKIDIQDFPTEVLLKLLGLLPDVDLKKLQKMTPRLETVINEGIGFFAAIGQMSKFFSKSSLELDWPEKVLRRGVSKCWVADLTETIDEPRFKFPKILRSIYFEGPIIQINFNSLLLPLTGLQHLTFHFSALANPDLILTNAFFSDCILQSLSLTSTWCEHAMPRDIYPNGIGINEEFISGNVIQFTKNCITLLKNLKSSRLATLLLSLPLLECAEKELTTVMIQCISRHGQTLKNFQIYWECIYKTSPSDMDADSDYINSDDEYTRNKQYEINWADFKGAGLRRFSFVNFEHTKNICDPDWIELIRRQQNLSELYFLNRGQEAYNTFILKNIGSKKLSLLKKILIHVDAVTNNTLDQHNPLDLAIFLECPNLTHFVLRGEWTILPENKPIVKNIRMLPKSIYLFSIRDILVKNVDAVDILGLEGLKRIRLVNIGCTEEFGLPLKNIFSIMDNKKIEEFEFTNSINLETSNWKLDVMQMCMLEKLRTANKLYSVLEPVVTDETSTSGVEMQYFVKDSGMFDQLDDADEKGLRANDICNVVFK